MNRPRRPARLPLLSLLLLLLSHPAYAANVSVVAVDPMDRLAGATVLGEWNTNGTFEGWTTAHVAGAAVSGGVLQGSTTTTGDAQVTLAALTGGPDQALGFNDYLQVRIKVPAAFTGDIQFEYGTTAKTGFATDRVFTIPSASIPKDGAFHTYRLDLGLEVWWRDYLRDLRLTPMPGITTAGLAFELDYVEVGDLPGDVLQVNTALNFATGETLADCSRLESKHFVVWWSPTTQTQGSFNPATHGRRALRMMEESFQVFCRKYGYNEPFRYNGGATGTRYKTNQITWYAGFWMSSWGGYAYHNVGPGGLADEGWGNPVPHEFAHCVQGHQPGFLAGGHWESHANYLRGLRNLHFAPIFGSATDYTFDSVIYVSNYQHDANRLIYADQRLHLPLGDYAAGMGLPADTAARLWKDLPKNSTLIAKLATLLPGGASVKDVVGQAYRHWPMLDFVDAAKIRGHHWTTATEKNLFFWRMGAVLQPMPDKPGWWRVPLERAPEKYAFMVHELAAPAGGTVSVELRGLDLPGTGEDWRFCLAAVGTGDTVRYSALSGPGTVSMNLSATETRVLLIVTATPDSTALNLDLFHNARPINKHADRLNYGYEVRFTGAVPASRQLTIANGSGAAHPNGGGWVGASALVDATAYVGPNAKVLGSARVRNNARIEDYAVIKDSAIISGNAVVSGFAVVQSSARIQDFARVRDRAMVTGTSTIKGEAVVADYAWVENTVLQDQAIARGNAFPFGGTISGNAIADYNYSMDFSFSTGTAFNHVPWGGWWDAYHVQTQRKPRGLVASYRVEETSGELCWDEFGPRHAFIRGTPVRVQDATLRSSVLRLDGTSAWLSLERNVADARQFTFGIWINPAAAATRRPVLFLGAGNARHIQLTARGGGTPQLVATGLPAGNFTLTGTTALPAGAWSHLAFTLDGTNAVLYVNGVPESSTATASRMTDVLAANDHLTPQGHFIGRDWDGACFAGDIEDARFYNVARTNDEIREDMLRRGDALGTFFLATPHHATNNVVCHSGVRNGRTRTLMAWVKVRTSPDVAGYTPVFDCRDERGSSGNGLGLDAGKLKARLDNTGYWTTSVPVTPGTWQHLALSFNGSTATLFTNGVPAATRTYPGPAGDDGAASKNYRIGFEQTSEDVASRTFFDGEMLSARIYERALTAAEIGSIDSDGDGSSDFAEGTADSNSDGRPDFLDPAYQGGTPPPPAAPTALTATAVSPGEISLAWTDTAANESGFKIEQKTGASGTWSQIAAVGANVTSFNNTGLAAGTDYYYRVRATNAAGDSPFSNEAVATTAALPPGAPASIEYPSSSFTGQYLVSWASADGASGYQLERSGDAGATWTLVYSGPELVFAEAVGNGGYRYRVRAQNSGGEGDWRTGTEDCLVQITAVRAARIVDTLWGDGLVGGNADFQGTQTGSTGDFNGDGVNDHRRTRAFSEDRALSPDATAAGKSTKFYGGVQATYFGAASAIAFSRYQVRNVSYDPLQVLTGSHTGARALHGVFLWQAPDFLAVDAGECATLDAPSNTLRIWMQADGSSTPIVRFLVKTGGRYYLSQYATPSTTSATRTPYTLTDPAAHAWAPYDPATGLDFDQDAAVFGPLAFGALQAVGYYYELDEASATIGFRNTGFAVDATVVPAGTFTPPAAPATLTCPANSSSGSYSVSWSASEGATAYQLERSADGGAVWTRLYDGPELACADLVLAGTYRYRVRAVNVSGTSAWTTGATDCVVAPAPATTFTWVEAPGYPFEFQWDQAASWVEAGYPDAANARATLCNTLTGSRVINIRAGRNVTIGRITAIESSNSSMNWQAGYVLIFDSGSAEHALWTRNKGSTTAGALRMNVYCDLQLNSSLTAQWSVQRAIELNHRITGAGGLVLNHFANEADAANRKVIFRGAASTYAGGTALNGLAGAARRSEFLAEKNSAFGTGDVSLNEFAQLTLTDRGATEDILGDTAALRLKQSGAAAAQVMLNSGVAETVGRLYFNGVPQAAGTWGSSASTAENRNDTYFAGPGVLTVLHTGDYAASATVRPVVNWAEVPEGVFQMAAEGRTGHTYVLERSFTLQPGSWEVVAASGVLGADGPVILSDPTPSETDRAFYRLRIEGP